MKIQQSAHKYIPALLLALMVLASITCAESTPTSQPSVSTATPEPAAPQEEQPPAEAPEPTQEPTKVPTEVPTNTPEPTPVYLGDAVEQFGYVISAVTVEDPAPPGTFYDPEVGMKLVAVEIILGNVSADLLNVNPLNAVLLDSEGFSYVTELGGREDQIATIDVFPGEKVRGWVAFSIPEEATPASIKMSPESFSSTFLQTSLAPPPEGHTPNLSPLDFFPPAPEAKLGDVLEQFGYSLTATAVEDPTTPGSFYDPKLGYKLVAVEIVVGNVSGDMLGVNPLNTILVDNNGYLYDTELGGRDDGQIATMDLAAGEKVKGWVAFEIPENATPASIKYATEAFSSNYLQVGLTE